MEKNVNLNDKIFITTRLSDYNYLSDFVKIYALKNIAICNSPSKIFSLIKEKYGNININYNSINSEQKNKLISQYSRRKNIEINRIRIEQVINLNNICDSVYVFIRNQKKLKNNLVICFITTKIL